MRIRVLSISIAAAKPLPTALIQAEMASLNDWIMFSPQQYFVLTDRSATDVSNMIRAHMYPTDFILVGEFSTTDMYGWAPGLLVSWLASARTAMKRMNVDAPPPPALPST